MNSFFSSYLVEGGCDRSGAGDRGQGVLAPDGLDAADAQREVAPEARVDVLAVAATARWINVEMLCMHAS